MSSNKLNLLSFIKLFIRSQQSIKFAAKKSPVAAKIARYGQHIGFQMLMRRKRPSISYVLSPISSTRYFEMPFAYKSLGSNLGRHLDVSSPSLFSFYIAHQYKSADIVMINPDIHDLDLTKHIISNMQIENIQAKNVDILNYLSQGEMFESISSISVIEHINGEYDDSKAIQIMFRALKKGGILVVTVPVDRHYWIEYRGENSYGLQKGSDKSQYFFQRHYDHNAVWDRLIKPLGAEPVTIVWYGEKKQHSFANYEKRWNTEGYQCTVNDAEEFTTKYQEFPSWEAMSGRGVCGLVFKK